MSLLDLTIPASQPLRFPIETGQFLIHKDFSIHNTGTQDSLLEKDPLISLDKWAIAGLLPSIPALEPVAFSYMYALAVKAVRLPESVLFASPTVLKVYIKNGIFAGKPGQPFIQYPDGGIPTDFNPDYKYIPGASKYAVNDQGVIVIAETGVTVEAGHNRAGLLLNTDAGTTYEISPEEAMLTAFGKYTVETYRNSYYYVDGNKDNKTLTNLTYATPASPAVSSSVDDHPRILNDA